MEKFRTEIYSTISRTSRLQILVLTSYRIIGRTQTINTQNNEERDLKIKEDEQEQTEKANKQIKRERHA